MVSRMAARRLVLCGYDAVRSFVFSSSCGSRTRLSYHIISSRSCLMRRPSETQCQFPDVLILGRSIFRLLIPLLQIGQLLARNFVFSSVPQSHKGICNGGGRRKESCLTDRRSISSRMAMIAFTVSLFVLSVQREQSLLARCDDPRPRVVRTDPNGPRRRSANCQQTVPRCVRPFSQD